MNEHCRSVIESEIAQRARACYQCQAALGGSPIRRRCRQINHTGRAIQEINRPLECLAAALSESGLQALDEARKSPRQLLPITWKARAIEERPLR